MKTWRCNGRRRSNELVYISTSYKKILIQRSKDRDRERSVSLLGIKRPRGCEKSLNLEKVANLEREVSLVIFRKQRDEHSYPPLSVGVSPNRVHSPTDMSRELRTVTTAARARPHLDFTMSILPAGRKRVEMTFILS